MLLLSLGSPRGGRSKDVVSCVTVQDHSDEEVDHHGHKQQHPVFTPIKDEPVSSTADYGGRSHKALTPPPDLISTVMPAAKLEHRVASLVHIPEELARVQQQYHPPHSPNNNAAAKPEIRYEDRSGNANGKFSPSYQAFCNSQYRRGSSHFALNAANNLATMQGVLKHRNLNLTVGRGSVNQLSPSSSSFLAAPVTQPLYLNTQPLNDNHRYVVMQPCLLW